MESSSSSREGPPPGEPWDGPIESAALAFVDLEMTGLDPAADRVIELCIERVRGGTLEGRLATLVRPQDGRIGATHIHGITADDLRQAPAFSELAGAIEPLLAGAIGVAHGAEWDEAFLRAEMARAGRPFSHPHWLDTLPLARRAFRLPSHRLEALASELGVGPATTHRAEEDVRVLRSLFAALVERFRPASMRELYLARHRRPQASPEVLSTAQRAIDLHRPVRIRYRPSGRGEREFQFHVQSLRTDLDPPVVLGYLQRTRGRRELRADRILSIELLRL